VKIDRVSRRMFLTGTGGAVLAIPLLGSLLPRQARAAAPPVRYLQWVTDHGQYDEHFWPSALPSAAASIGGETFPGIKARALTSIQGQLSDVLVPEFDAVREKMNVVRGLSMIVNAGFHNACAPTCASYPREDNHIPFFSHSVDSILETSSKVYAQPVKVPALRLTPGVNSAYKWGSFSWTTQNGQPFKLPCHEATQTALSSVFEAGGGGGEPAEDPALAARLRLLDEVLEDYKSVSQGGRISASDKAQLSSYMDLLADVKQNLALEIPVGCKAPALEDEKDFDILHRNATNVAVAALLCGATRVVAYHCYQGSPSQYDEETFHAWAHDDHLQHASMMSWRYRQLARLLSTMDEFVDVDGNTLLDNSFVYAGNELSEPGHGGNHLQNMPIVTAGGAGGLLTTGQYIDFGGRLLNNLLVTVFETMGLAPEDYEREGVVGFGDYEGPNSGAFSAYLSDAERRKPLPYLFKG
jgi:hypothetical protein